MLSQFLPYMACTLLSGHFCCCLSGHCIMPTSGQGWKRNAHRFGQSLKQRAAASSFFSSSSCCWTKEGAVINGQSCSHITQLLSGRIHALSCSLVPGVQAAPHSSSCLLWGSFWGTFLLVAPTHCTASSPVISTPQPTELHSALSSRRRRAVRCKEHFVICPRVSSKRACLRFRCLIYNCTTLFCIYSLHWSCTFACSLYIADVLQGYIKSSSLWPLVNTPPCH